LSRVLPLPQLSLAAATEEGNPLAHAAIVFVRKWRCGRREAGLGLPCLLDVLGEIWRKGSFAWACVYGTKSTCRLVGSFAGERWEGAGYINEVGLRVCMDAWFWFCLLLTLSYESHELLVPLLLLSYEYLFQALTHLIEHLCAATSTDRDGFF
jgi:hypothetical protein